MSETLDTSGVNMTPEAPMSSELENILSEENARRARLLVENLNNGFFEEVGRGLLDGQKMTFEFEDGTKRVITNTCNHSIGKDNIEFFVDDKGRQRCLNCRRSVAKRKVFFNKTMASSAIKMFEYAVKNNVQFIHIRDVKLTHVEYSKMNYLVKFGLAYRDETIQIHGSNIGVYGVPRKRISDFVRGQWKVAACFLIDPTIPEGQEGKREMSAKRITIDQVPSIDELRSELGNTLTSYEWNEQDSFESQVT